MCHGLSRWAQEPEGGGGAGEELYLLLGLLPQPASAWEAGVREGEDTC